MLAVIGMQEVGMVVGGGLVLLAVAWVANKLTNKNGAAPKQ